MRNWNQYLELWQQKRSELPIDTDAQADWSEMQGLLDEHLPIQNPGSGGTTTGGQASNVINQLSHLAKFKLFYAVGALIVAGAITYSVIQHRPIIKNNKATKTEIRKDSLLTQNTLTADSLAAASPTNTNSGADSASNHQNLSAATNTVTNGNTSNNPAAINNKADVSSVKSGGANDNSANNHIVLSSNTPTNRAGVNSYGRSGSNTYPGNNIHNSAGQGNDLKSGNNDQIATSGSSASIAATYPRDFNAPVLAAPPTATLSWSDVVSASNYYLGFRRKYVPVRSLTRNSATRRYLNEKTKPTKANKDSKNKNSSNSKKSSGNDGTPILGNWDLGILAGVSSNGGFTPKEQNHNFYGSLSPDIHLGAFGNYHINDSWALGFQAKFFVPHTLSGTYNYVHKLSADTSHTTQTLIISDERKVYTVDVPIHVIYKATPNISLKAGAVVSLPVRQVNGPNSFIITGPLRDSAVYYNSVTNDINASKFDKKVRVGASAGIGFTYKTLWLDATYNFQKQKVSSALGGYNANANTLQPTLGIKLKSKK